MNTAYLANERLERISDEEVEAAYADPTKIYVCSCGCRAWLRGGPGTTRKIHYFGNHTKHCKYKNPDIRTPLSQDTDFKTNIVALAGKEKKEKIVRPKPHKRVDPGIQIIDEDGYDEEPGFKRKRKTVKTASEISLFLDKWDSNHVIGSWLDPNLRFTSKYFYCDGRHIAGIRKNGYVQGYGLAIVKPTHPDQFGLELKEGEVLLRDIYSTMKDPASVMLYILTFSSEEIRKECWNIINSKASNEVIAIMGWMDRVENDMGLNIHMVNISHPDNIKRRPAPGNLLESWEREKEDNK